MARAHTYYLPHRDVCLGERASDAGLEALLRRTWERLAAGVEPTIVDGVSAWLDDASAVQARLVRGAAVEAVTDPALLGELAPLLADPAPTR